MAKADVRFGFDLRRGVFTARTFGLDEIAVVIGHHPGKAGRGVKMIAAVKDWRPYFETAIEPDISKITEQTFRGRGRGGVHWPAIKRSTIASKRERGYRRPSKPLVATGEMKASLVDIRHPEHYRRLQRFRFEMGSTVKTESGELLTKLHEHGTRPHTIRARRASMLRFVVEGGTVIYRRTVRHPGMPARPPIVPKLSDLRRWARWAHQFAFGAFKARSPSQFKPRGR